MPKRGARPDHYFEHDNRGEEMRRTVSFKRTQKPWGGPGPGHSDRRRFSKWNAIQLQLGSDVEMGSGRNQFRGSGGAGRGNRARGRRGRQNSPAPMRGIRYVPSSSSFWYKVLLPYGGRYDKKWVLETLLARLAPDTFTAVCYTTLQTKETYFYLDDHKIAEKLANIDRRIQTEDGFRLSIVVRPYTPLLTLDDNFKECLKLAMNKRFNPETNALDLSRLHLDPDLIHKFVPLNQKPVLAAVLAMVTENCRTLQALDLSHNMLYTLDAIKSFVPNLSHLRVLHLANNKLTYISQLDPLKGLDLEALLMDSNPVCAKYDDQGSYVSDIRKRLPKLLKLDGVILPPPILFDVEKTELPPSRGSFLCNEEGKDMVRQFLEQYYAIFDSTDRNPLKDAYHERAMLSMTCFTPHGHNTGQGNRDKTMMGAYLSNNRNLKRVQDLERRMQNLMCGHSEIMKFLSNFPTTQHDPLSFAVDLLLYTPSLIQICVSGVFRETRPSSNVPMRAFSRSLVIVPQGQGFCIVNETLTITNATSAQFAAAFKTSLVPVAPAPTVAPTVVPLIPVPIAPALGLPSNDSVKRQMVEHVAKVSGMNLVWSQKCLDETNWNLDQALLVFTELNRQGTIPAEAFVH